MASGGNVVVWRARGSDGMERLGERDRGETSPAEAADARQLLGPGAHAVPADSVLEKWDDDGLVEPGVKLLVGRELACGPRPAAVEEAGGLDGWQRAHDVAEDDAAR